jgi:hypothetical protein
MAKTDKEPRASSESRTKAEQGHKLSKELEMTFQRVIRRPQLSRGRGSPVRWSRKSNFLYIHNHSQKRRIAVGEAPSGWRSSSSLTALSSVPVHPFKLI